MERRGSFAKRVTFEDADDQELARVTSSAPSEWRSGGARGVLDRFYARWPHLLSGLKKSPSSPLPQLPPSPVQHLRRRQATPPQPPPHRKESVQRSHVLSSGELDRLVNCDVCFQLVFGRALFCQHCDFHCHLKCQYKGSNECSGGAKREAATSSLHQASALAQKGGGGGTYQSLANNSTPSATLLADPGPRAKMGAPDADITFITERIMVLGTGGGGGGGGSEAEIWAMLVERHGSSAALFDLSGEGEGLRDWLGQDAQLLALGWGGTDDDDAELAPPLEHLCAMCKELDGWLASSPSRVALVRVGRSRGRAALLVSAYLHYTNIAAPEHSALERFAMRRFSDEFGSGLPLPSHKRYLMYFSGLLSGAIRINSEPIFIHQIIVTSDAANAANLALYLKLFEKLALVCTTGVVRLEKRVARVGFAGGSVEVRGDVVVRGASSSDGRPLFRLQINTCALQPLHPDPAALNRLAFPSTQLDEPEPSGRWSVELLFSRSGSLGERLPSPSRQLEPGDLRRKDPEPRGDELYARVERNLKTPPRTARSDPSTDSGVSSNSTARRRSDEMAEETPFIRSTAKRSTLDSAKSQLVKIFGRTPSPEPQRIKAAPSNPASIHSTGQQSQPFPTDGFMDSRRFPDEHELPSEAPIRVTPPRYIADEPRKASPPPPPPQPTTPLLSRKENPDIFQHKPPAVLPKPRTNPASPAPVRSRPISPSSLSQGGEHTPGLIDVGLVGEERYDKQSKAFRYVTASALQNHFKSPKKQTRLIQQYDNDGVWSESEADFDGGRIDLDSAPPPVPPSPVHVVRVATPVQQEVTHAVELKEESPQPSSIASSVQMEPPSPATQDSMTPRTRRRKYNAYRTLDDYESDMDDLCDPEFYMSYASKPSEPQQAQAGERRREPPPIPPLPSEYYAGDEPRRRRAHSRSNSPPPEPRRGRSPAVPASPLLPPSRPHQSPSVASRHTPSERNSLHNSVRDLEILQDIYQSNQGDMPRPVYLHGHRDDYTPSPNLRRRTQPRNVDPYRPDSVSTWDGGVLGLDGYRPPSTGAALPYVPPSANVPRSLASTPSHSQYRDYTPSAASTPAHDQFSITSDFDPDDWLESQLEKLRSKKEAGDVTYQRRRHQEKVLLEELKNIHVDSRDERGRHEEAYSVEGFGSRDLKASEEESTRPVRHSALSSLSSPTSPAMQPRNLSRQAPDGLSRSHPLVTGKPPTPPPRERSRTPPSSPRRMSPMPPAHPPPSYDSTRRPYHSRTPSNTSNNFDHLESLLWDGDQALSPSSRHSSFLQSPKSILKKPRADHSRTSNGTAQAPRRQAEPTPVYERAQPTPVYGRTQPTPQRHAAPAQNFDTSGDFARAETPAFPVGGGGGGGETPTPFHPLLYDGARGPDFEYRQPRPATAPLHQHNPREPSPALYYAQSRLGSMSSLAEPMEVIHHHPIFVKDTSKYWYKPTISREDAIKILRDKPVGTFIVRDSNSFPGAFGLALKVDKAPPGVKGDGTELVRHFLIEPSAKGVKLKGCNNEPVFGTLSALVYQHSITPLALPNKLLLPDFDPGASTAAAPDSAAGLLEQGAACNLTYLHSCDMETLTGPEAVRRAVAQAFALAARAALAPVSVHFKVSAQGVTVTDNTRRLFFRRHYPTMAVTFCGLDPEDRRWNGNEELMGGARIFGFVARKMASRTENACHIFAELEPNQPANAIVNFVTKVMMVPQRQ